MSWFIIPQVDTYVNKYMKYLNNLILKSRREVGQIESYQIKLKIQNSKNNLETSIIKIHLILINPKNYHKHYLNSQKLNEPKTSKTSHPR